MNKSISCPSIIEAQAPVVIPAVDPLPTVATGDLFDPPPAANARPSGYDEVVALAKALNRPSGDLIALARNNDPFFSGSLANRRDADWFLKMWRALSMDLHYRVHLRQIHYKLVSQSPPPLMPSGKPYSNTIESWQYLNLASKAARYLQLVDAELFSDHRNPAPNLYAGGRAEWADRNLDLDWDDWELPSINFDLVSDFELAPPRYDASGYVYGKDLQPFHLEVWIEKSTMNDVLIPVCQQYGVNLVTSIGFQSIPSVIALLRRVEQADKPARIFYISDFDPAGAFMPDAVARQIEYWRVRLAIQQEIKLQPLVLTRQQVVDFRLPSIPIKESDRRKANFETRYGMEATELDALEALKPGVLASVLESAIQDYWDDGLDDRMDDAKEEADVVAKDATSWISEEQDDERQAIQDGVCKILEDYRERLETLSTALDGELEPFKTRMEAVRQAIQGAIENVGDVFTLPDHPEPEVDPPDESGWLFDSSRDYLEQIGVYKARRSLVGNDVDLEQAA